MTASADLDRGPALLNFDPERYLRIQSGAVARGRELGAILADRHRRGRLDEVVFLGAGGAGILMESAARLAGLHGALPVSVRFPAEESARPADRLGSGSVVVIPSLSGTTTEARAALDRASVAGALSIVLTAHADSPLAEAADLTLVNEAADDTSSESFLIQSLVGIAGALAARGEWAAGAEFADAVTDLPSRLLAAKVRQEPTAPDIAGFLAAHDNHIFTAAGMAWPEAHYYAMCILEEMQWIRTRPVHAANFFHGTLEIVDESASIVVLAGTDETRPLTDRVLAFAPKHCPNVQLIDAAEHDLGELPPEIAGALGPVVLAAVLERVSAHLEVLRDHPLSTRRYYRRVEY